MGVTRMGTETFMYISHGFGRVGSNPALDVFIFAVCFVLCTLVVVEYTVNTLPCFFLEEAFLRWMLIVSVLSPPPGDMTYRLENLDIPTCLDRQMKLNGNG